MDKKVSIKYGEDKLIVDIPKDNFLYHIAPKDVKPVEDEGEYIRRCLRFPISSSSLYEQLPFIRIDFYFIFLIFLPLSFLPNIQLLLHL